MAVVVGGSVWLGANYAVELNKEAKIVFQVATQPISPVDSLVDLLAAAAATICVFYLLIYFQLFVDNFYCAQK